MPSCRAHMRNVPARARRGCHIRADSGAHGPPRTSRQSAHSVATWPESRSSIPRSSSPPLNRPRPHPPPRSRPGGAAAATANRRGRHKAQGAPLGRRGVEAAPAVSNATRRWSPATAWAHLVCFGSARTCSIAALNPQALQQHTLGIAASGRHHLVSPRPFLSAPLPPSAPRLERGGAVRSSAPCGRGGFTTQWGPHKKFVRDFLRVSARLLLRSHCAL